MSPSHPPSLLTLVTRTLKDECQVPPGAPVAIAVSGGPDSMALLHAMSQVRAKFDLRLLALTVDHGLRPEAATEAEMVQSYCSNSGIDCQLIRLNMEKGANLQARARELRYREMFRVLDSWAGENAFLATAHHKQDRVETLLLRLLRGTSVEGLAVLPAKSERLLRPLIRATRRDVELHVERHGLPTVSDPSNQDSAYLRVRVRHELLPLLADLGPGIVNHLEALADDASRLDEPMGLKREHRRQLRRALLDSNVDLDLDLGNGLHIGRKLRS